MNILKAYNLLETLADGKLDYLEDYKEYIRAHKERVKQFSDWLEQNLPEVFEQVDREEFRTLIEEHDESKYSEEEFLPYANHFFGPNKDSYDPEFNRAWEHHWQNNEHHPEYWLEEDMPLIYILEMLCDWGSFSIEKKDFSELNSFYYNKAKDDPEKNLSENTKEIIEEILSKIDKVVGEKKEEILSENFKSRQLEVILKNNPAPDSYHTWVRSEEDILTFEEALKTQDYSYMYYSKLDFDESYPWSVVEDALKTGRITVYSSYPIEPGTFVSPSSMEAGSYSGTGKLYSKECALAEIAWIDPTQGQYTGKV